MRVCTDFFITLLKISNHSAAARFATIKIITTSPPRSVDRTALPTQSCTIADPLQHFSNHASPRSVYPATPPQFVKHTTLPHSIDRTALPTQSCTIADPQQSEAAALRLSCHTAEVRQTYHAAALQK